MRRRSRKLTADDTAVWERVTQDVSPLSRQVKPEPAAIPPPKPVDPKPPGAPFAVPKRRPSVEPLVRVAHAPDPMLAAAAAAPAMDAKAFGRLKRGKLSPEARLDLHGMTAERAHQALRSFILHASGSGLRLVLVITGKGRAPDDHASAARRGILRNAVPVWLSQPPLAPLILQLSPAHQRHGGGGAYYVYLRRRR